LDLVSKKSKLTPVFKGYQLDLIDASSTKLLTCGVEQDVYYVLKLKADPKTAYKSIQLITT
jgi:hypothetical protein